MKTVFSRIVFFVMLILTVASLLYANSQKVEADKNRTMALTAQAQAEANAEEAVKMQVIAEEQRRLAEEQTALAMANATKAKEELEKCQGKR